MSIFMKTGVCFATAMVLALGSAFAQETSPKQTPTPKPDFSPIAKVVKDGEKMEGFFTLYKKKESLFLEIPSSMMEKPFMFNVSIARGIAQGFLVAGMTHGETILYWKVADKKMFLVDKNIRHVAKKPGPIASAVAKGFSDSVIAALPIKGKTGGTCLVDIGDFLFTDYAEIGRLLSMTAGGGYSLDRNRTTWGFIKTFPQNVEIEVAGTYAASGTRDLRTVSDPRSVPITTRYSFSQIPKTGYTPRPADNRIGYFLTAVMDYTKKDPLDQFVRYINRWNLQKADPSAGLSPPKKPIVFYIEKSVPYEYRPIVRAGILEWNKAFEKAGFLNAIEVRYQEEDASWDAEDVRYNTVRWMTGEAGYAIGPSRTNPQTGEIYDADILVDSGWLNFFEWQYETYVDEAQRYPESGDGEPATDPRTFEFIREQVQGKQGAAEAPFDLTHRCEYSKVLKEQMAIAAVASIVRGVSPTKNGLPQEFIRQGLKDLITHEVGHTLGLRHNFKSSAMIPLEDINNKEIIEKTGLVGSVMDYGLVNIAPKGEEQGYYFSPTLGAWDYLAIEYGYKEVSGGGSGKGKSDPLKAIASIASTSAYMYATDGDVGRDVDPLTTTRDMSDDPLGWAKQRTEVITELWKDLMERITEEGEGYEKASVAFLFTLFDVQRNLYHASRFVGGFYVNRDQKGDPEESPTFEIVPACRQREALTFVCENALKDEIFRFDPDLIARITPNRWDHWGSTTPIPLTPPIHDLVLAGQMRIISRLFSAPVLQRVHDGTLYFKEDEDVFTLDEIYSGVTNAVWSELKKDIQSAKWNSKSPFISSYRRDLQRTYLKNILLRDLLNPYYGLPQDARSMAWTTLDTLKKDVDGILQTVAQNSSVELDPLTLAHLQETQIRIDKALEAAYSVTNY